MKDFPRGVRAEYRPSKSMPNILNVLIGSGNMIIQLFSWFKIKTVRFIILKILQEVSINESNYWQKWRGLV